jgi:hypothetical protein
MITMEWRENMKIKQAGWAVGVLVCLCSGAYAEKKATPAADDRLNGEKITLARYAKALVGEGNVTVEIAPYKKEDGSSGAILLFKGVEGAWDGKAVNYSIRPGGADVEEYVTLDGSRERVTLTVRKRAGKTMYSLYLPDAPEMKLVPSDGAAQLTTPRAIFDEYKKQNPAP